MSVVCFLFGRFSFESKRAIALVYRHITICYPLRSSSSSNNAFCFSWLTVSESWSSCGRASVEPSGIELGNRGREVGSSETSDAKLAAPYRVLYHVEPSI